MSVLVEGSAESISPADPQAPSPRRNVDHFGQRAEWSGLAQGPVWPMFIVEGLELNEHVQEMVLVSDQGAVEELAAAGLDPALHDGVHSRYSDPGLDHFQARVSEQGVEAGGELRVPVPDEESGTAAGVLEVHEQVPSELDEPVRRGVGGDAQDPDAARGVLDDGEDVQARPGQGADLEQVAGQQRLGLATQELGPGRALPLRRGRNAVLLAGSPRRWMRRP